MVRHLRVCFYLNGRHRPALRLLKKVEAFFNGGIKHWMHFSIFQRVSYLTFDEIRPFLYIVFQPMDQEEMATVNRLDNHCQRYSRIFQLGKKKSPLSHASQGPKRARGPKQAKVSPNSLSY
jgi:hypothetical protein